MDPWSALLDSFSSLPLFLSHHLTIIMVIIFSLSDAYTVIFGWYRGLELVPIGDAEAIVFLAPVLIVILGRLVLKEPLSAVFPGTILLTLSGL